MRIIRGIENVLPFLISDIKRYGSSPSHHPYYLTHLDMPKGYTCIYAAVKNVGGMILYTKKNLWRTVGEPVSASKNKLFVLTKILQHIFQKEGAKKLFFEDCTAEFRKKIIPRLKPLNLRAVRPNYKLVWPMYSLHDIDERLAGKKFKGMRYVQNRFGSLYEVEFCDARTVDTKPMLSLMETWKEKRTAKDIVYAAEYSHFIKNNFPECRITRALFLNKKLRGLTAGWRMPNTQNYYLFMNIHDYSDEYLGEFITLDHFLRAKRAGYSLLDFGGSDEGLLAFKKKFHPIAFYTTYDFSILRAI